MHWPTENVSLRKTAIHVREVLPDTITISRQNFREASQRLNERKDYCVDCGSPDADDLMEELFGPAASHANTGENEC